MGKILKRLAIMMVATVLLGEAGVCSAENSKKPNDEEGYSLTHHPIPIDFYRQAGFDEKFNRDFLKWKITFVGELNELLAKIRKDNTYGKSLLEEDGDALLAGVFDKSIEKSSKGKYLKRLLISGFYETNRDVWAQGTTFIQLIKNDSAKVIGYGGKVLIDEKDAEILYMQFNDFSKMTDIDLKENVVMSAFKSPILPKYGVAIRNVWPALVFRRGENKKLVMVGLSSEMVQIIQRVFNAQIM